MPHRETGKFQSGEVEVSYRLFGDPGAMPVLIVHGLSYFSYDWIMPAEAIASDRQVAAMDMRGFGDSGWASDYSVPSFAGDIVALLDHLKWRRAILIGHSMGGRNGTYYAARNPDRAAGLILVDWSPENAPAGSKRVTETVAGVPDFFESVSAAMHYFGADPQSPRQIARFEAYLKRAPGGFAIKRDPYFREQFRRVLATGERPKQGVDMWAELSNVRCPILVLRGARSDMFAAGTVPRMLSANPLLRLVQLDTAHDVAGEDLPGFLRETRAFLGACEMEPSHA